MPTAGKQQEVTVQGPSLAFCLSAAVAQLGAPADQVELEVIRRPDRKAARPLFVARAVYRPPPQAAHSSEFAQRVTEAADGMLQRGRIDELLGDERAQKAALDGLLEHFDQLSDDLKQDLAALAEIRGEQADDEFTRRLRRDGTCTVGVAEDGAEARLSITPPVAGGVPLSAAAALEALAAAGVAFGIDPECVERLCARVAETMEPCHDEPVAACRPAVPGRDGRVEFLRNGRAMDAREVAAWQDRTRPGEDLWSCKQGEPIARLVPPSAGVEGMTVRGEPISPGRPQEAKLHAGKNVRYDEAGRTYHPQVDGLVIVKGDHIEAETIYVVRSDVSIGTGDVEFDGQVWVTGSVKDGCRVRAGGDVVVDGGVEAAEVTSARGTVTVRQGIQGRFRAAVQAAGDVSAKYIENANVLAGGDVICASAIIRSNVTAGGSVLVQMGKGTIFGGNIRACRCVRAKVLGAVAKVPTEIVLGVNPAQQQEVFEFDKKIAMLNSALEELENLARSFSRAADGGKPLTAKEREVYGEVCKKILLAKFRLNEATVGKEALLHQVELQTEGTVQVASLLYPGVTVRIGNAVFRPDAETRTCTLRYDNQTQTIERADYREA
jgi:uncharacterized protein (DUF342 family)